MTTSETQPEQSRLAADRLTGEWWERQFCDMEVKRRGVILTPHQKGRDEAATARGFTDGRATSCLLPDITVWSNPTEHHEIKHKNLSHDGMYGLEQYRLDDLVHFANTTGDIVFYTIHDWESAGGRNAHNRVLNNVRHWWCADVTELAVRITATRTDWSYRNGRKRREPICYWTRGRHFEPLAERLPGAGMRRADRLAVARSAAACRRTHPVKTRT